MPVLAFLKPYGWRMFFAGLALVFTSAVTLSLGQGVLLLIDEGLVQGSKEQLTLTLMFFTGLVFFDVPWDLYPVLPGFLDRGKGQHGPPGCRVPAPDPSSSCLF